MSHALRNEAASMEVNFPDAARSAAHGSLLTRKKTLSQCCLLGQGLKNRSCGATRLDVYYAHSTHTDIC